MGNCSKEGVVYTIACKECSEVGIVTEYYGETSRSEYLRGKEHSKALRDKGPKYPMAKHQQECHPTKEMTLVMMIVKTQKAPPETDSGSIPD